MYMNKLFSVMVAIAAMLLYTTSKAQSADTLKTAVIKVINLHCDGDMPTIKKRLLNQEGIDEVTFNERKGQLSVFTVKYHTAVTSEAQIEKQIESTPGCDDKNVTPYRVKKDRKKHKA